MDRAEPEVSDPAPPKHDSEPDRQQAEYDEADIGCMEYDDQVGKILAQSMGGSLLGRSSIRIAKIRRP